jgi:hypothetical protein
MNIDTIIFEKSWKLFFIFLYFIKYTGFINIMFIQSTELELAIIIVIILVVACWGGYFCLFGAKETFMLIDTPVSASIDSAKTLITRPIKYVAAKLNL